MSDANRPLLFGLLALQIGLIDQGQLVAAFQAWTRNRSLSLVGHLNRRGDLTDSESALLDSLVEQHIKRFGGDVEKSLASIRIGDSACGLGLEEEAEKAERELAEFRANDPQFREIDAQLAAVLGGREPRDNAERLALAQRAYDTKRYASAAKLWSEALDADPKLADDRKVQHRYNAACAASLAADGQGIDPAEENARAGLRAKALGWLRAELAIWSKEPGPNTAATLRHWRQDSDLDSVRMAESLAKLPDEERRSWQALWDEVEALLKRASAP